MTEKRRANNWKHIPEYEYVESDFLNTVGGYLSAINYIKIHEPEKDYSWVRELSDMQMVIYHANLISKHIKDERKC